MWLGSLYGFFVSSAILPNQKVLAETIKSVAPWVFRVNRQKDHFEPERLPSPCYDFFHM
jgi:hypothetical protein